MQIREYYTGGEREKWFAEETLLSCVEEVKGMAFSVDSIGYA